ncbi:hypothetical protein TNCV_4870491 [Trichonephila clavipes]|nr:hypothetical protein TNCV_4870491 [Trichonephila clavipes]
MGDDVMDIHASQSDESLMDDLSPRPSSSKPCGEHVRRLDDLLISWNCRGSKLDFLTRSQIHHIHASPHALLFRRPISEEYHDKCVVYGLRRDVDGDTSPTGGILRRSNRFVRCAPGTCSSKRHRRKTGDRPYKSAEARYLDFTVAPHANLNFSRGIISPADFPTCRLRKSNART